MECVVCHKLLRELEIFHSPFEWEGNHGQILCEKCFKQHNPNWLWLHIIQPQQLTLWGDPYHV